ncbi:MAG TPA: hypothetical protein QF468_05090 [Nitrospinota bacterium]|jgi:hypothetical protein|nr:hypothetical protein [Nitrospinota bacterium]
MLSFFGFVLILIAAGLAFSVPINTILGQIYKSRKTGNSRKKPSFLTIFISVSIVFFVLTMIIVNTVPNLVTKMPQHTFIEVNNNLNSIYTLQKSYRAEHSVYAGIEKESEAFDDMEWFPSGKLYYSYYCGDNVRSSSVAKGHPKPGTDWPYSVKPMVSANTFVCMAVGNLDKDPFMDVWMINDKNELRHLYNDASN